MGQTRTALALILCNLFAYLTRRFIFASLNAGHGLAILQPVGSKINVARRKLGHDCKRGSYEE